VTVNAGDRVTAGQTLVTIDASDIAAQTRQARGGLEEANQALAEVEYGIARLRRGLTARKPTSIWRRKHFRDLKSLRPRTLFPSRNTTR